MDNEQKEATKEDFIEQMTYFQDITAQQILEVLKKHEHMLSVEVLGLISIVRALINTYGDEYLLDTAVDYLKYQKQESE